LGVFVVGWVDMDGEDLKILSSPIKRDSSINEDPDRVGFLGRILDKILDRTRFSSDTGGFLIAGLDITDLRKLELVPTLFGFLTTGFLARLVSQP
jgi:hypothetical protein